ncbi:uncharacterized protein P174DRAFT_445399 [Aspergillus novofumigatus IBT 16806]|uniref:Uncharacterized protein n=1 Tax=Aspergillus novofumigatus (strain IBT 16806) TaxID=1392255 RepID=A0A2I1BYR0_ASPN1|nr:uncharacterized protein P174DRAFT_445399 [Aspergillus novofumigatus IBT 16806]PKX90513.1 hypothetical protein P174DRAFT_445399 [Aspergillus novofumigatus IBT 16806]
MYCFGILGNSRMRHTHCHSIADMAYVAGGTVAREVTGQLFIICLCPGDGQWHRRRVHGAACSLPPRSVHRLVAIPGRSGDHRNGIHLQTGERRSADLRGIPVIYVAVLIVVVGVTTRDRPAAAPQEGLYDLGFVAINNPGFTGGMVASCIIFVSSAGTSAFLTVISEMRNPKD